MKINALADQETNLNNVSHSQWWTKSYATANRKLVEMKICLIISLLSPWRKMWRCNRLRPRRRHQTSDPWLAGAQWIVFCWLETLLTSQGPILWLSTSHYSPALAQLAERKKERIMKPMPGQGKDEMKIISFEEYSIGHYISLPKNLSFDQSNSCC